MGQPLDSREFVNVPQTIPKHCVIIENSRLNRISNQCNQRVEWSGVREANKSNKYDTRDLYEDTQSHGILYLKCFPTSYKRTYCETVFKYKLKF